MTQRALVSIEVRVADRSKIDQTKVAAYASVTAESRSLWGKAVATYGVRWPRKLLILAAVESQLMGSPQVNMWGTP